MAVTTGAAKPAPAVKKPMGKIELIDAVAKAVQMEKTKVKLVIDATLDTVLKELKKKDGKVQLTGFGTFAVALRKKRTGVNPKTGEKITIPARKVPKFTAGKALKDAVEAKK
jgi:DNA-binding protein HU-beta